MSGKGLGFLVMTSKMKIGLLAAGGAVAAVAVVVFSGAFDGLLQRTVTPQQAEVSGQTSVPKAEPQAATEPGLKPGETVVPVFDLVRVEPTGDAVIAGQGSPDSDVEVLSGETVIARGKISQTGEWAIVLADPLKAGAHDLTIRTHGADGSQIVSNQSVAVSIPEGGKGEVLVVVNQPGAPAEVLQVPTAEETEQAVALAESEPPAPAAAPAPAPAATTSTPAPATTSADGTPPAATPPANETVVAAAPATAAPAADAPAAATPPHAANENETAPAAAAPAAGQAPAVATVPADSPAPTPAAPAAPAAAAPAAPATADPAAAATGGDTTIVMTHPAPGDVVAEPAAAPPAAAGTATAPATPVTPATPATSEAPAGASAGTEVAQQATAPSANTGGEEAAPPAPTGEPAPPVVSVEAVELENGKTFFAAGAAAPGATLRVYVDDALIGEVQAMDTGRWLLDADHPLQPGAHAVRVDQVKPDGSVVARAGVPFDITGPVVAAVSTDAVVEGTGEGSMSAGTGTAGEARIGESKTLIIRKGDNLWQISRRLYGQGVRYSTIYAANTDQIANPHKIFPGQVFIIPEGDRNWKQDASQQNAAPTVN